jgi:hypothetical protein
VRFTIERRHVAHARSLRNDANLMEIADEVTPTIKKQQEEILTPYSACRRKKRRRLKPEPIIFNWRGK